MLFELTGSALWVGASVAAQFIPMFLLSPWGGSLADRFPRRQVLLVMQAAMGMAAVLLWGAWLLDWRDPWLLLLVMAVIGGLNGLSMPSWQGFVHDLVPREDLMSAVTFNSLQFNAARAIGPAIGGVLLATLGVAWAFGINAASFGCVLLAIALVRSGRGQKRAPKHAGVARQFGSALKYIGTQPGLVLSMIVAAIIGFLGNPVVAFTVVFAGAVFEVGPAELGAMNAALGIGALLAAPIVASSRWNLQRSRIVAVGLPLYAVAMAVFALAPSLAVGVVALGLIGGCFLAVVASINTATQSIVADPFRGRVLAVRLMVFTLSAPLGSLAWGALSDWVGPRPTVLAGAVGMAAAAAILVTRRRRFTLSRLDDPHDTSVTAGTGLNPDVGQ